MPLDNVQDFHAITRITPVILLLFFHFPNPTQWYFPSSKKTKRRKRKAKKETTIKLVILIMDYIKKHIYLPSIIGANTIFHNRLSAGECIKSCAY